MRALLLAVTLKYTTGTDFPGFNRTVLADCENVRDRHSGEKKCVAECKATGGDWSFEETHKDDCEVMDSCFSSWMLGDEWTADESSRDNRFYMEGKVKTDATNAADCMKFCAETEGCIMFDYFPSLTNPSQSYCRLRNKQHLSAILSVTYPVGIPPDDVHLEAPCTNVPNSCKVLPCYQENREGKRVNLCIWRSKNHITGPRECKSGSVAWIGDLVKDKDKYTHHDDQHPGNHDNQHQGNRSQNEIHKHTPGPGPDYGDDDGNTHQQDGSHPGKHADSQAAIDQEKSSRNKKIGAALGGAAGGLLVLGGIGYGASHFMGSSGITTGTEFGEEVQASNTNVAEREQVQDIEEQHFV